MRKFRTLKEALESLGRDAKIWCSSWPPNMYFRVIFEGKKYCIGSCHSDGFEGEEIWLALQTFCPDIYYSAFKPKKRRPK